jgi:uncharacterized protein (DUF2141 family)
MKARFLLLASLLVPLPAEAASVIVTVNGIEVGKGIVKVALCDKSLSIEGCPLSGEYRAVAESQQFVFENVPDGSYGFVSYQDANSNSKFDTNVLGIPKEDYGLSGAAGDKMIPSFKDTLTPVSEATPNEIRIELRSFGERKKQNASR